MDSLKSLLKTPKKPQKAPNSEYAELIGWFMDTLNPGRLKAGFKPYSAPRIAKKLEKLDMHTLKYMRSYMSDLIRTRNSDAACKWFEWSIRNHDTNELAN